jgi:two-component system response regulator FixJ
MEAPSVIVSVVDDDVSFREALAGLVGALGFQVASFSSGYAFLASENVFTGGCLISDVNMPGMSGLTLMDELATRGLRIPTILVTAEPESPARHGARSRGALAFLTKPIDQQELFGLINGALAAGQPIGGSSPSA